MGTAKGDTAARTIEGVVTEGKILKLKKRPGSYATGVDNLLLRVYPTGRHSWVCRVQRQKSIEWRTIGSWPDMTVNAAKEVAAARVNRNKGDARTDVASAVETFMDTMIRPRYRKVANAEVYARLVADKLGNQRVDSVDPRDVAHMIRTHIKRGPVAAMRLFSFTKQFFAWCAEQRYVERSPIADMTKKSFGVREVSRERKLLPELEPGQEAIPSNTPLPEIAAFWNADDLVHLKLLRALLLSGCRIQELQRAERKHLSGDWLNIPAEHSKNGVAHRVYVTSSMRKQFEPEGDLLFDSVSPTAVQAAVKRWCNRNDQKPWTPHDLRRTFATLAGNVGVPPHVVAKLLNHTLVISESLARYFQSPLYEERKAATLAVEARIKKATRK